MEEFDSCKLFLNNNTWLFRIILAMHVIGIYIPKHGWQLSP